MEQAISSGDQEKVSDLLRSMDNASATRQLTGCYGGRDYAKERREDDNGLYRMTVPLLHAAYTGKISMFSTVHGAMRDKLRVQQMKRVMSARDLRCRSILTMAVLSKNTNMVRASLAALEEHLAKHEVKELLMAGSKDDGNVLIWAAASGRRDVFKATVVALQNRLTASEVKGLMMYEGSDGSIYKSILTAAAASGDKDTWEAVLAELEKGAVEVNKYMAIADRDSHDSKRTVVHRAVQSGSTDTFTAVLNALDYLTPEERNEMVVAGPTNLLHTAAESGSKDMFEAVLAALRRRRGIEPLKVTEMLFSYARFGRSTLYFAAESGSAAMFEAVLGTMAAVDGGKVKSRLMPSFEDGDEVVASVLHAAANSGSTEVFKAVLTALKKYAPHEVSTAITSTPGTGSLYKSRDLRDFWDYRWTILHSAAHSGSHEVVEVVLTTIVDMLDPNEVLAMIKFTRRGVRIRDNGSIFHAAAMSGSTAVFEMLLRAPVVAGNMSWLKETLRVEAGLLEATVKSGNVELFHVMRLEMGPELVLNRIETNYLLRAAARTGRVEMWEAVTKASTKLCEIPLPEVVLHRPGYLLRKAFNSTDPATVRAVYRFVRERLPVATASTQATNDRWRFAADGLCRWAHTVMAELTWRRVGSKGLVWAIEVLSCLLEYPVVLRTRRLVELSRKASDEWLTTCFLETVSSVENPFVAGMNLSVALTDATRQAREGERRKLRSLQDKVHNLLLQILERLPQTVLGFHGGMAGCAAVFEPEIIAGDARGLLGPLWMVMQSREHMETFCAQPLIVDFMWRRFTHGLPDLLDSKRVLSKTKELEYLADFHLAAFSGDKRKSSEQQRIPPELAPLGPGKLRDTMFSPRRMLHGRRTNIGLETPLSSVLPGAQFLAAGVVAVPDAYYRVPVVRMVLDAIVYVAMLAVFCDVILLHDDGPPTVGEILFAVHVSAGVITELREMKSDWSVYIADHWNPIDFLGLGLVGGGLVFRLVDETSSWGRALYALSAPLLFSRVLFFAQIFRFQGPMIQVIFSMIGELVKFGVVIFVVMVGFAMSFYALFRDVDTFGQTFLTLFKGMLGEVGFFDEFLGDDYSAYEEVATVLFVFYLVVIAIMLLNLLIAVLSTSHAKVQEKAEQEFRVSRALLINRYRLVVDEHLLPPPFNIVQLVLSLPFLVFVDHCRRGSGYTRAKEVFGRLLFWLVMGTLAVFAGTVLWVFSALYAPYKWYKSYYGFPLLPVSIAVRLVVLFFWCIVGAPLCLVAFWLAAPLRWLGLWPWNWVWGERELSQPFETDLKCVDKLLRDCPGGLSVGELQEFLEDPMSDPKVRQDENRRPTTVEHIKQLRDRVENAVSNTIEQEMARRSDQADARLARIEQDIASLREEVSRKMDGLLEVVRGGNAKVDE